MLPLPLIEARTAQFRRDLIESGDFFVKEAAATSITCETCADNDSCEFAWDFYNTADDCLAEK